MPEGFDHGDAHYEEIRADLQRIHNDVSRLAGNVMQAIRSYGDLRDTVQALVPMVDRLTREVFGEDGGLHDQVGHIKPVVDRLEHDVYGNGMPGMKLELDRMRTEMRAELGKMQQQMKIAFWIVSTIGGSTLAASAGALFGGG